MNKKKILSKLTATQFENLTFDLMMLIGLKNATWRTPGADGGRDIEGEYESVDLSRNISLQKWYIECKKYKKTLDWPTVYKKIAYADSHDADFLLIVTTANLSPRCKEEIRRTNRSKRHLTVRFWDGTVLADIVWKHPFLLYKYGFESRGKYEDISVMPVLMLSAKSIQAAYGKACINDTIEPSLELSAALVDLFSARILEQEKWGFSPNKRFLEERDSYDWLVIEDAVDLRDCDSYGIRALVTAIRFCFSLEDVKIDNSDDANFEIRIPQTEDVKVFENHLTQIALWSNLEICLKQDKLKITIRELE